jgi:hypothetical protein
MKRHIFPRSSFRSLLQSIESIFLESFHAHYLVPLLPHSLSTPVSHHLPVLNPPVIQGKDCARGALGGVARVVLARTR